MADLYQMDVEETRRRLRFPWKLVKDCQAWQQLREGAYLLRTNLQAGSAEQLWSQYIQLTEVEAAFRFLKSELLVHPLFHQLERRVKSQVLVAFLGYALWVTLKHLLDRKGSKLSPAKALSLLSSVYSADIILPTTDGRQIRLRRATTPNQEQKTLLEHLGLELPERLDFSYESSTDSAAG